MNKDTKRLYTLSIIITALIILALFLPLADATFLCLSITLPAAIATFFLIKKRSALSIHKREVLIITTVIAALYVMLLFLSGYYFGFKYTVVYQKGIAFFSEVLPIILIIISVEIIRCILIEQKKRSVSILVYFFCIGAEVLMHFHVQDINGVNDFMDMVGLTLVPAVSAHLAYHYLSARFGFLCVAVYRIIITLYPMLFPIIPAIPDALLAVAKALMPIISVAFIRLMYEKQRPRRVKKSQTVSTVLTVIFAIFMISTVMIVSCRFPVRALVVATGSMTGEINKGDAVVYTVLDDHDVKEGEVVVFNQMGKKVVHRVVEIKNINGELQYYTKGDANEDRDRGYITRADIEGKVHFKISYVGYPTLWLREQFK